MIKKLLSLIFAMIGIAAAIAAVNLSMANKEADPVMLVPPEEAKLQVVGMMDALCDADFAKASTYMLGQPDLGVNREPSDPVGVLIWNAFLDSMSYETVGDCYGTEQGLAQNVTFSCMDITSVTAVLKDRSWTLLETRVAEADDPDDIYDENMQYREDVVLAVLYDAAAAALKEDAKTLTVDVTVNMVYQNEAWWIVADRNLLDAISGGILY